jgi:protein-S-isoprenylcysteine O-methyltransferase Ste14
MLIRALFAFLLLPGTVAYLVPLLIIRGDEPLGRFGAAGMMLVGIGSVLLLWCVRDFYVAGKGTLAPWSPPRDLVSVGLYRFSRNPMYVAVTIILLGWALGFWSRALLIYALVVLAGFHLRVVFGEEPWLARTHGERWRAYAAGVPRWVIRSKEPEP